MNAVAKNESGLLVDSNEWNFERLELFDREIGRIAADFDLDTYPNQIEVIRSDQMLDANSALGLPNGYSH